MRAALAGFGLGRARKIESAAPRRAETWLRFAVAFAPTFGEAHQALIAAHQHRDDPLGAVALARRAAERFDTSTDALVTLGHACSLAYRTRDALWAFERALQIEERPDAAMAAGTLYRRLGDPATAGARFARAFAAGAGPDALRENAHALRAAGDPEAAAEAIAMWEKETGGRWVEAGPATRRPVA
jgi:tetratricopeptide (TPR) repeat protein